MKSHADDMMDGECTIRNLSLVKHISIEKIAERHGVEYPWLILVIHTLSAPKQPR